MRITVSAPGKIFLMGDHFVVYGKPALLSCINKRVEVTVETNTSLTVVNSMDNRFILEILNIVKNHLRSTSLPNMKITVSSQIKNGYHLGSSAAVASATIAALLYHLKKIWNPQTVNQLAYKAEKIKHGNPSGADNSAAVFGGFVWYRKELEFLKSVWELPLKIRDKINNFYLIDTGPPLESTKEMVAQVAQNYSNNKKSFEELFSLNELQTKNIATALKEGNSELLTNSIKIGQSALEKIGVVSQFVLPFIREVEKSGGSTKILGGGGKTKGVGYLLCFHNNQSELKKIADKFNFPIESIILGEEGLRLEKKYAKSN